MKPTTKAAETNKFQRHSNRLDDLINNDPTSRIPDFILVQANQIREIKAERDVLRERVRELSEALQNCCSELENLMAGATNQVADSIDPRLIEAYAALAKVQKGE